MILLFTLQQNFLGPEGLGSWVKVIRGQEISRGFYDWRRISMETFTLGCFDCDLNEEEVRFEYACRTI